MWPLGGPNTYTYDDSSTSTEEAKASAHEDVAQKQPDKKKDIKPAAAKASSGAANAKAGAPAGAQGGLGRDQDQRRLACWNSLLRTAMETASSCGL
eukprot:s1575_g8.t1